MISAPEHTSTTPIHHPLTMSTITASNCPPIRTRGRFFYQEDKRFLVRGVAYQTHPIQDAISDDRLASLKEDIQLFKELGLNTLLVYYIDSTKKHTQAMKLLEEAGIYVYAMVSTPSNSINRMAPKESYNPDAMASFFKTVDIMAEFPNTLGLLVASQLVIKDAMMPVAAVIKAVVRDLKKYMKLKHEAEGQRVLPIGYNAATGSARDKKVLAYLTVGSDVESLDFWTCSHFAGNSTSNNAESAYRNLIHTFRKTTLPLFISEYGNNTRQPRLFNETTALYSPPMSRVFSGGCAYEFWQGANAYGLVEILEHGKDKQRPPYKKGYDERKVAEIRKGKRGTLLVFQDFMNYKARLADVGGAEEETGAEEAVEGKEEQGESGAEEDSEDWQAGLSVPESCVDWREVERELRAYKVE
ncbi:glycolipid anchored surface [Pyrenophora seminiperda CCB06]|uniref:1,3-beta-glucanosyltransferase n=1 Tax=Pyrenophora seminiperda CCB06 TaxID=1302712 RepID=A0A3M7M6G0_9PLEO|nr:glycolipid anchored surface [Pyrenophora seminiperda CCB06]